MDTGFANLQDYFGRAAAADDNPDIPAKEHGYGVVHQYCGHGVGFSPHEA